MTQLQVPPPVELSTTNQAVVAQWQRHPCQDHQKVQPSQNAVLQGSFSVLKRRAASVW